MGSTFKACSVIPMATIPSYGAISPDRTAIVGADATLFLYQGSNSYYEQYSASNGAALGVQWAELDVNRRRLIGRACPMVSIYVPNKASCLPDMYPLLLKHAPTLCFRTLRQAINGDPAVVFCEDLFKFSAPALRFEASPWRHVDTLWSEFGCLLSVNEVLRRWAIPPLSTTIVESDSGNIWGDLSRKFRGEPILEERRFSLWHDGPVPKKIYDAGDNSAYEAYIGRRVVWDNPEASTKLHLLVIGNSFAGTGTKSTEMTYWFARRFSKVTFLHSQYLPTDVLDAYRADLILYQGLERFLPSVPADKFTASVIEDRYIQNAMVRK